MDLKIDKFLPYFIISLGEEKLQNKFETYRDPYNAIYNEVLIILHFLMNFFKIINFFFNIEILLNLMRFMIYSFIEIISY